VKSLAEVPGVIKEAEVVYCGGNFMVFYSVSWERSHTKKYGRAYGFGYPLIPRGPSVARRAGNVESYSFT